MRSFVQTADGAPAPEASPSPDPAVATTTIVPPRPGAVSTHVNSGAYVDGEISQTDLKMPYLSCVQAVGPKSTLYAPGSLILGETQLNREAPKPQAPSLKLRVMFAKATKTYVENLPYNPTPGAPRPRVYKTAAEVGAVGGVLEWRGNVGPTFIPKLTSLLLVRSPEGLDDGMFNLIDGDKTYAPAMISFQKTSYSAAKTFLTDLSLSLRNDPTSTFYDLFWAREPKGANWVWVAKLVRVRDEKPTDTLIALANKLSGAKVEPIEDDIESA